MLPHSLFIILLGSAATVVMSQEEYKKDKCDILPGYYPGNETKTYIYYLSGFDYDGLPVVVMEWGHWDVQWLVDHPQQLEEFNRNMDQYLDDLRTGALFERLNNSESSKLDSIVAIVDFDGLDLRRVGSGEAIQTVVGVFAKFQLIQYRIQYGYNLFANVLADQLIAMSKPFMGNYLERFETFGTNSQAWKPKLLRKIPRSQLPPAFGGYDDFIPVARCSFL